MADTFTKEERSRIMAKVRSKDTQPEVAFRRMLYRAGVRYRLHYPVDGKPDIAVPSRKIAVFIDGCFWHGCPKCFRAPASNKRYWNLKIERNVRRDKAVNRSLKSHGWRVIRAWEHEIKDNPEAVLKRVTASLR
jgi:DNA mismatch endonuclease (patch repair protein)